MRKSRLEKLLGSNDPAVAAVAGTSFVADMLRSDSVPLHVVGIPICNKENLKRALAYGLHRSVDGSGLNKCSQVSIANKWVDSPTHLMSGANYISAIKVRGNLMATAGRMARGRPQRDVACDAWVAPSHWDTFCRCAQESAVPGLIDIIPCLQELLRCWLKIIGRFL